MSEAKSEPKIYTQKELEAKARAEVRKINKLENQLVLAQEQLASNPQFMEFLATQKKLEKQTKDFWDKIKQLMIDSKKKKLEGDWGWITLGETFTYEVTDVKKLSNDLKVWDLNYDALREDFDDLPSKYKAHVPDAAAIKEEVALTRVVPTGVKQKVAYKLMKKINPPKELKA